MKLSAVYAFSIMAAFGIVSSSWFQALGNGVYSMLISMTRQLLVLLPAAWLLAKTGQVGNVWWAFPIAELVSVSLSIIFTFYINKKIIRNIEERTKVDNLIQ